MAKRKKGVHVLDDVVSVSTGRAGVILQVAGYLAALVFGYLYFAHPRIVEKTIIKTEVKIEKVYIKSDATITGATTVTTTPAGIVSAGGNNITITEHTTSTTTVTDIQKEKEVVRYSYNMLMVGGQVNMAGDYGVYFGAKIDSYYGQLSYCINKQVWGVQAGVVLFQW